MMIKSVCLHLKYEFCAEWLQIVILRFYFNEGKDKVAPERKLHTMKG